MQKTHIPTGRVSIESVVRFLVEELEVEPQQSDWSATLGRLEREFAAGQTWGTLPPEQQVDRT